MSAEATRILELAERLAREAGRLQRESYEGEFEVHTKSAIIDLVTDVDRACEQLIVDAIEAERRGDAILAEDGGGTDDPDAEWRWVIDPLDGTPTHPPRHPPFAPLGQSAAGPRQ